MLILINQYFRGSDRQHEYDECLKRNIENKYIDGYIIVLEKYEDGLWIRDNYKKYLHKIRLFILNRRASFKDFFEISTLCSTSNDVIVLSNADIFFDESIVNVRKLHLLKDMVIALSRYEWDPDKGISSYSLGRLSFTQDVWCFVPPLKLHLLKDSDITIAKKWAGDNYIAYIFFKHGYAISNPFHVIKCYHYHTSNIRHTSHTDYFPPPHARVMISDDITPSVVQIYNTYQELGRDWRKESSELIRY